MSDMKCPFCNETELEKGIKLQNGGCMLGCPKCKLVAPNIFWQELIRTRKALGVAVETLKETKDGKIPVSIGICMDINDTLDKIKTVLEQKD